MGDLSSPLPSLGPLRGSSPQGEGAFVPCQERSGVSFVSVEAERETRIGEKQVDIAAWLTGIGLEQYKQAFDDNEIDAELLPRLTADDLKDMGIVAVGHRRKLLIAIAELQARPDGAPAAAAAAEPTRQRAAETARQPARRTPPAHRPVRRPGRLDGARHAARSGRPSRGHHRLPPAASPAVSALRRLRRPLHGRWIAGLFRLSAGARRPMPNARCMPGSPWSRRCAGSTRSPGRPARSVSPRQHRDRPRRGRRPHRLRGFARGCRWSATRPISAPASRPSPNRIRSSSPDTTRRLTGGLFDTRNSARQRLKGRDAADPKRGRCWAKAPSTAGSRRCAPARWPLVGRADEIELLLRRWEQAQAGEGRVFLLSGAARHRQVAPDCGAGTGDQGRTPCTASASFCSLHYQDTPLHPIISNMVRHAGFKSARTTQPPSWQKSKRCWRIPSEDPAGQRRPDRRPAVAAGRRRGQGSPNSRHAGGRNAALPPS